VLAAFGALLFPATIAPLPVPPGLRTIGWACLAAGLVLTLCWAAIDGTAIGGSISELPLVATDTQFGHVILLRLGLLALAALALAFAWARMAAVLAGLAAVSVAGQAHALAMYEGPSWLLLSESLHLLAAGAWLGSLVPLLAYVRSATPERAGLASRRFARLGTMCVIAIVGTALFQASVLVGSVAGLVGTAYGLLALTKTALLAVLLGIAARNRFRLTPALAGAAPERTKQVLVRSIALETSAGLLVVLVAGLLGSLAPAMHLQPIWPFPWVWSFDAVGEEPEFLREVLIAGGAMMLALLMVVVAFVTRARVRWGGAVAAALVLWLAAPHLDLLFVPAYPTVFWTSPTGFSVTSIASGPPLFATNCASCHGAAARGDGPAGKGLPIPPADLTAAHLWEHSDGQLFWWLSHGMEAPDGTLVMPGFAEVLTEDQRWALIDWIRAHNAGLARAETGNWPVPLQTPGLNLSCIGAEDTDLAAQHGKVVRIVFGPAQAVPGALTVAVDPDAKPEQGVCVATDAEAPAVYATVTGLTPDALHGSEVLVDPGGWLRSVLPGNAGRKLADAIHDIGQHPLAAPATHDMTGMKM